MIVTTSGSRVVDGDTHIEVFSSLSVFSSTVERFNSASPPAAVRQTRSGSVESADGER